MKNLIFILLFVVCAFPFTSGKVTVGTGGTYATFTLAIAAMDSLTANCTLEVVGNVTEAATVDFNTEEITGSNLVIKGDAGFTGIPLTCLDTVFMSADDDLFVLSGITVNADDTIMFNDLFLSTAATSGNLDLVDMGAATGDGDHPDVIISNCLMTGTDSTNDAGGIYSNNSDWDCRIFNVMFWQLNDGLKLLRDGDTVENCVAYECRDGFVVNNVVCFANNAAFNCSEDFDTTGGFEESIGKNNVSSDATAQHFAAAGSANNSISKTASTEFISLDETNVDFLVPSATADTVDVGGIAPSIALNTTGIQGKARPGTDGFYSIGAVELCDSTTDSLIGIDTTVIDTVSFSIDTAATYIDTTAPVDTVLDTTVLGDTTIVDSIHRVESRRCSVESDSQHSQHETDSIEFKISCLGDTASWDTFSYDTSVIAGLTDTVIVLDTMCTAAAIDSTIFLSDTIIVNQPMVGWLGRWRGGWNNGLDSRPSWNGGWN